MFTSFLLVAVPLTATMVETLSPFSSVQVKENSPFFSSSMEKSLMDRMVFPGRMPGLYVVFDEQLFQFLFIQINIRGIAVVPHRLLDGQGIQSVKGAQMDGIPGVSLMNFSLM